MWAGDVDDAKDGNDDGDADDGDAVDDDAGDGYSAHDDNFDADDAADRSVANVDDGVGHCDGVSGDAGVGSHGLS